MDTRLEKLSYWVHQHPGFDRARLTPVSGDASFRRYFRATGKDSAGKTITAIAMDAPPEREDCHPFVALAHHWREHGVAVPQIFAEDPGQGFLLLEDFGDQLMLGRLNGVTADDLYDEAMAELIRIQQVPEGDDYPLPPYDEALLDREMNLFPDWLLEGLLQMNLTDGERCMLETTFAFLRESALAQPRVTVHRDYHSRNLLVRPDTPVPGVIDFQDAVNGPITYDIASLLKDCYIDWPAARRNAWLEDFRLMSREAGLHQADSDTFRQWFELMGMQRHLKAAGIFARLYLRDGKSGYLADIPRTVNYLAEASRPLPALRHFHQWLQDNVLPAIHHKLGTPPDDLNEAPRP
ncbi:aminoglycoside phosphotransferase family protein [Marinobacter zhanjiangensis]|uniref:Cell wall phosphotransferase n=1 Tax=Marinobacter zhanjiangensis TaxID=578215 RepID=A0ABQ3ANA3_9GAMM|nr:phosphotransferase [Marinobacter zhanjiangensis]GGY58087.1 cell wall phosphotransferase [Marinobacter zhanjiangensis]